ncbi:RNA cap guanine-N2 methyltransferase-domain-containing protein [Apodospora peruviana]|uniref:Trimethylguanosine synthase n=1 Tax=Apodospora peruviana TaxID=516989 RepID=A0AAE0MEH9_9PEZI|nr:RNA cap guanine-N2 methyltransferase-domain-containing protein [Apodospora peruviana]
MTTPGPLRVLNENLPLTDECHHYDDIGEVPWDIQKYWHQRYSIFQYYDYDVRLTDDAWFGVTPEPVAIKIAQDLANKTSASTLIDLFGGAGGNVIAFALTGNFSRIIAVEKDAATLACAQHNAEVYGVVEYITWVHGDCFDYMAKLKSDPLSLDPRIQMDADNPADTTIFASPPWGGVSYAHHEVFDLTQMQPYSLEQLHGACAPFEHTLFLPRSSDLRQIAKLAPDNHKLDVVQYCMRGASKAMVVYVPAADGDGLLHPLQTEQ